MDDAAHLVVWMFSNPVAQFFLLATLVTAVIAARPIATATATNATGVFITICGLGGALAVTIVNRIGIWDLTWTPEATSQCLTSISRSWGSAEALLNLCLLVPLAVGLMLATRSLPTTIAAIALAAIGIEVAQATLSLGACQRGDMARNALGGLAAAAITALALHWHDRRRKKPELPRARSLPTL